MRMNFQQVKESMKDKMFFRNKRLQSRIPLIFPLVLNIELTNKCSENCIWCPRADMTRNEGFMNFELFRKIIDEASHYPKLRRLYIHWMGEPLLHPQVLDFLEYAKHKDIAEMIVIATNGVPLTLDKMRRLIELKIDELFISIDAATDKKYRELKNTDHFRLIDENIKRALALRRDMKAKLPHIRVKFLETDFNFSQRELFKSRWGKIADSVFFEKDLSTWDGKNEKVNVLINRMECYLKNYGNLPVRYPCDRLWYLLAIQWNGKVSPCVCDWNGENAIADLNHQTITDLWSGKTLMEYRQLHISADYEKVDLCRSCTKWGTRNMGDWLLKHKDRALSKPKLKRKNSR